MYRSLSLVLILTCFSLLTRAQEGIDLSGLWRFRLDASDCGMKEVWQNQAMPNQIQLPGTTDEGQFGEKTTGSDFGILTRAYKYIGPAWYQRDIEVPASWTGKRIFLELERVMWESRVFVDGKEISMQDALNSAHWHDLGVLTPGKHVLTLRINNDLIHNIGDKGHAYTEYTQSIWNGAVGRIRLVAKEPIRFTNPQIFTGISPIRLQVTDTLICEKSKKAAVELLFQMTDRATNAVVFSQKSAYKLTEGKNAVDFKATMPANLKLWDDMNPNLYDLTITLLEKGKIKEVSKVEFGFREVTTSKSKLLINGKPVFLRGNLDCVHFPLTGYPSCKVEDWERIFRIYKAYGLNHVRYHSWCPPEAAFIAANRIGIYIQAECIWIDWWMTNPPADRKEMYTKGLPQGLGKNPSADAFIQQELKRMVQAYGNYPSFVMMCIGNELGNSDFSVMESWLKPFAAKDARRLYSVSSARKIMPLDQYMVTHHMDKLGGTRGLRGASTEWDFESVYGKSDIPVIAHEIGQWPVYPKWDEIKKYKGVLKARNLESFYEQARKNHIEEQNADFVMASGALNQILYKNEIESFLRTPSCAGLQLLSLQDYQGQGEALIGWLDVFYDSKGVTTPEKFRMHCDTTVPLLRISKFVWQNNERFTGRVQVAHYGNSDFKDALYWKIKDAESNVIANGTLDAQVYKRGSSAVIGEISCDFSVLKEAKQLTVEIGFANTPIKNSWNIWVYPASLEIVTGDVYVTDKLDAACEKKLEAGEKVLLMAASLGKEGTYEKTGFHPLYWSFTFFPGQSVNTIGLLVKDKHPLFAGFPTDRHSDWQWESIYRNARAFILNDYPADYKPIAQPVDDFHRNHKLGAIYEVKVGKGKLLVCGFDLSDEQKPVARQLKSSMLRYMNSAAFQPNCEVSVADLKKTFVYIEPLKSVVPQEFSNALLYVECAAQQTTAGNQPWVAKTDRSELHKKTTYDLQCDGTWKDETGTSWHGKEMTLTINCPQGIIGSLYVYFHDWNNAGRRGNIVFEGRDYTLGKHDGKGMWVKLHVMREDTNNGSLVLKTKATAGTNLMITKVVLIED